MSLGEYKDTDEERTGYINMKCSTGLGPLMHQVAQEKIIVDFNPRGASDIWDSCGISAIYWNDLLDMKRIAVIMSDGGGEVFLRKDVEYEVLKDYPEPIDWERWIINKIQWYTESDEEYLDALKKYYTDFTDRIVGDDDIALTINNICKHYEKEDYAWIEECCADCRDKGYENEYAFCDMVRRLPEILDERQRFIKCAKWLCEQFGCLKARPKVQKYEISLRELENIHNALIRKNIKALNELLSKENKLEMVAASMGTTFDQYFDALKEQESYKLEPVDITEGWDAGFILPDGTVYAMNGPDSAFVHVAIADKYFEENDLVYDPEYFGKDFQLMSQGWIKFNKQKILYDGYMAHSLGKCCIAGLTQRQKDVLCDYIDSTWNKMLYFGIHGKTVTKDEFLSMTDEDLEEIFS